MEKQQTATEWQPSAGERVQIKVFSNWSKGTYIGFDVVKQIHIVREDEEGGGNLFASKQVRQIPEKLEDQKEKTVLTKLIADFNAELEVATAIGNGDKVRTITHLTSIANTYLTMEKEQTIDFAYTCKTVMAVDRFAIKSWYEKQFKSQ
jgi:hypothetical protein